MDFVKKHPAFSALLGVLVLVGLGLAGYGYFLFTKEQALRKQLADQSRRLKSVLTANPAPTEENLASAEANLAQLKAKLADYLESLKGQRAFAAAPKKGSDLIVDLRAYVDRLNNVAAKREIVVPKNFTYGFARYVGADVAPPSAEAIPLVFRQREILGYVMDKLFEAKQGNQPMQLVAVEREAVEGLPSTREGSQRQLPKDIFVINELVSARVPNAVDTMAFRVVFRGYSDALRQFLNSLSQFELPLVVRSVEVTRVKPTKQRGLFDTDPVEEVDDPELKAMEPVVADILSEFSVVIEYIQVRQSGEAAAAGEGNAQGAR